MYVLQHMVCASKADVPGVSGCPREQSVPASPQGQLEILKHLCDVRYNLFFPLRTLSWGEGKNSSYLCGTSGIASVYLWINISTHGQWDQCIQNMSDLLAVQAACSCTQDQCPRDASGLLSVHTRPVWIKPALGPTEPGHPIHCTRTDFCSAN